MEDMAAAAAAAAVLEVVTEVAVMAEEVAGAAVLS